MESTKEFTNRLSELSNKKSEIDNMNYFIWVKLKHELLIDKSEKECAQLSSKKHKTLITNRNQIRYK